MSRTRVIAATAAVLAIAGCSDTTNPMVGRGQNVMLSFATRTGTGPVAHAAVGGAALMAAESLVITDGANTLIIRSVEVLLREVELKRANVSDCDSTTNSDACEEFEVGATLVTLPLAPGAAAEVTIAVDSGTYTEVEFDIHKLGTDPVDAAFLVAHPGWPANTSIRVTGSYNGTAFTFVTDLDQEQEIQFVPPLVIDATGTTTNLTMRLDALTWFRNGTGGPLINPATANQGGPNKSLVDNNIKNSIEAFHDEDRDANENDG